MEGELITHNTHVGHISVCTSTCIGTGMGYVKISKNHGTGMTCYIVQKYKNRKHKLIQLFDIISNSKDSIKLNEVYQLSINI